MIIWDFYAELMNKLAHEEQWKTEDIVSWICDIMYYQSETFDNDPYDAFTFMKELGIFADYDEGLASKKVAKDEYDKMLEFELTNDNTSGLKDFLKTNDDPNITDSILYYVSSMDYCNVYEIDEVEMRNIRNALTEFIHDRFDTESH